MPTNPTSEPKLHQQRQVAESFGADPERYDRARPRYPQALVEQIVAATPGPEMLDVGSGTGIVARQLAAAGCKVLGVEPDARMAEFARGTGVETEVATFEAWEPAGRQFDAIVSGQTWHWVDAVAGGAKAAQALRPGGRLVVFWNVFQPPPEVNDAFAAVYREVMPDMPVYQSVMPALEGYSVFFTKAADGIRHAAAFDEPEEWRFDWEQVYTRDDWVYQVPTFGGHHLLPPAKLNQLQEGLGAAVDAAGGSFTMSYTTVAVTATRAGAA
ncbi:class I SAM-dependent methyltransferase [Polymorphospora sp. NPDC051019]|uniref:class I SAM-dependent methyltransferase n=1 Tax=Polymorphospora sp. NPDC051019 TaxID=3155725 RepID=UPI003414C47B